MNFTEAIEYLATFPDAERGNLGATAPSMSLQTMSHFLERLNTPQTCARTIHIAGSKGKGSTATLIASILKAHGYKTALYTSPHLHSYRERIALDLKLVSEADFAAGLTIIHDLVEQDKAAGKGPYSTFGLLTALFFLLSRDHLSDADWQVVEVGLGGSHDATNVFKTKEVAVITSISLEHTAILGKTTAEIAANKAGIVTPGCICVLAPQRDAIVREVVASICKERGAELVDVAQSCQFEPVERHLEGQTFSWHNSGLTDKFSTHLLGDHQLENAATAITVANVLKSRGVATSTSAIGEGLLEAALPGRFEVLPYAPEFAGYSDGDRIVILDGAHNQDSAKALAKTIEQFFPDRKCVFIIGANRDKDVSSMWKELAHLNRTLIATRSDNPRAMNPEEIIDRITRQNSNAALHCHSATCIDEAFHVACRSAGNADLICVTGSFYLVAEARKKILEAKHLQAQPSLQGLGRRGDRKS